MIHLRYKLSPQTNFRAAFTNGIARPNYYDLVPYRIVFEEDEEMAIGNPTIKPTTAYSFDLMLEHYFEGIGIVSGGVFYKGLSDIIFESVYEEVGGQYDGYEVYQSVNGGSATLFGFEINWQQQLSFLPGFLNGLGIFANYTYTTSNADLPGRDDANLPGQAGNVGNIALSYQKYGFSAQLSLNYHSKYIDIVGEDGENDIYYDDHIQLDFSANQQILSGLSAYVQILNLTDAPLRYYIGDTKRPIQREFYSWWVQAGFKFNLN
jgi:TonB-dependent receptor